MPLHIPLLVLHVVGAGVIIGTTVYLFFLSRQKQTREYMLEQLQTMRTVIRLGLASQIITGLALFFLEREELENNLIFWLKMIVFLFYGWLVNQVIEKNIREQKTSLKRHPFHPQKTYLIQLLIVLLIITLGVLIGEME